ncbi:MAG: hypothetical protein WBV94_00455 [Blastocatellia bacterium]
MMLQLSFELIMAGAERCYTRGDFSAIPLGKRPPYLATARNKANRKDGPIDYLFRLKTTLQVGLLLHLGQGMYYLAPPTLLSPRHKQDNQIRQIRALDGWQAVCSQLEVIGCDGTAFSMTGSDDEPLLPVGALLDGIQ